MPKPKSVWDVHAALFPDRAGEFKAGDLLHQFQKDALAELKKAAERAISDEEARKRFLAEFSYFERRQLIELLELEGQILRDGKPDPAFPWSAESPAVRHAVGAEMLAAIKHLGGVRPYSELSTSEQAWVRQLDRRYLRRSLSKVATHHQVHFAVEKILTWYFQDTGRLLGYRESELDVIEAGLKVAFPSQKPDDQVIGRDRITQIVKRWRRWAKKSLHPKHDLLKLSPEAKQASREVNWPLLEEMRVRPFPEIKEGPAPEDQNA